MPLFLAIISHLGWGIGDIFVVMTARRIGTNGITFWSSVVSLAILLPFVPFFLSDFSRLTLGCFLLIFALSFLLLIGHMAFNEALRIGNPSLVGVIAASFVAVSVIISVLFLGERLSIESGAFIGVTVFGVVLCLVGRDFRFEWGRGELLALVSMSGWGVYYAFIKIAVAQVGWFVPGFIFLLLFPLVALFAHITKSSIGSPFHRSIFWVFIASVLLISIAEFSYNIAMSAGGDVSRILPIAGSYPALFVALSALVFKEKILKHQWVGVTAALVGIVALSAFG